MKSQVDAHHSIGGRDLMTLSENQLRSVILFSAGRTPIARADWRCPINANWLHWQHWPWTFFPVGTYLILVVRYFFSLVRSERDHHHRSRELEIMRDAPEHFDFDIRTERWGIRRSRSSTPEIPPSAEAGKRVNPPSALGSFDIFRRETCEAAVLAHSDARSATKRADSLMCELIRDAIRQLPTERCNVFLYRVIAEMSEEEIARRMQLELKVVKAHSKGSIAMLRKLYKEAAKNHPELLTVLQEEPDQEGAKLS
jgi:DNA-directed RNA polymerase specialized sigma24 family protein